MAEFKEQQEARYYPSDGAETWIQLLKNTALFDRKTGKPLLSQRNSNYRKDREDSKQTDLFCPPLLDIPYKDDYGLMDINPFGLGKRPRFTPIVYDLKDVKITVTGSGEYGLATIHDYDIVIYMISHLARQMNEVKFKVEEGMQNPRLPQRNMRVNVADLFKQLKIEDGGKQIALLKAKLQRLKGTNIEIVKKLGKITRRDGSLSLIGDYEIISNTKTGHISEFSLEIPKWIYAGVVSINDPTVLTLSDDYMLLKSGYHKYLARIAKKSAGENCWDWKIEDLHVRSGTTQRLYTFKQDIKKAIDKLKDEPLKDYDIVYKEIGIGKKSKMSIFIKNRT